MKDPKKIIPDPQKNTFRIHETLCTKIYKQKYLYLPVKLARKIKSSYQYSRANRSAAVVDMRLAM
jgi:hypothetical protein